MVHSMPLIRGTSRPASGLNGWLRWFNQPKLNGLWVAGMVRDMGSSE
nr:hypothetical protein Q903MT_gene6484 [Picea sitchensis]